MLALLLAGTGLFGTPGYTGTVDRPAHLLSRKQQRGHF
jgi:hypothetical protein